MADTGGKFETTKVPLPTGDISSTLIALNKSDFLKGMPAREAAQKEVKPLFVTAKNLAENGFDNNDEMKELDDAIKRAGGIEKISTIHSGELRAVREQGAKNGFWIYLNSAKQYASAGNDNQSKIRDMWDAWKRAGGIEDDPVKIKGIDPASETLIECILKIERLGAAYGASKLFQAAKKATDPVDCQHGLELLQGRLKSIKLIDNAGDYKDFGNAALGDITDAAIDKVRKQCNARYLVQKFADLSTRNPRQARYALTTYADDLKSYSKDTDLNRKTTIDALKRAFFLRTFKFISGESRKFWRSKDEKVRDAQILKDAFNVAGGVTALRLQGGFNPVRVNKTMASLGGQPLVPQADLV